jgi:hypothetical protein
LVASKESVIEVNADKKNKYMVTSRDQNAGRSHNITLIIIPLKEWKSSNIWEQLSRIKILCRKKLRPVLSYHWEQKILSYSLLSKNVKIKAYRNIMLPVVLYGRETWSLTLREERRLRVFENRMLRRVFGPMRYEVTGE